MKNKTIKDAVQFELDQIKKARGNISILKNLPNEFPHDDFPNVNVSNYNEKHPVRAHVSFVNYSWEPISEDRLRRAMFQLDAHLWNPVDTWVYKSTDFQPVVTPCPEYYSNKMEFQFPVAPFYLDIRTTGAPQGHRESTYTGTLIWYAKRHNGPLVRFSMDGFEDLAKTVNYGKDDYFVDSNLRVELSDRLPRIIEFKGEQLATMKAKRYVGHDFNSAHGYVSWEINGEKENFPETLVDWFNLILPKPSKTENKDEKENGV